MSAKCRARDREQWKLLSKIPRVDGQWRPTTGADEYCGFLLSFSPYDENALCSRLFPRALAIGGGWRFGAAPWVTETAMPWTTGTSAQRLASKVAVHLQPRQR